MTLAAEPPPPGGDKEPATRYATVVAPILKEFCHDCHGDGANKGGVTLDGFASEAALKADPELWLRALKNLRAGIMPPPRKPQPSPEQRQRVEEWIKAEVFLADNANPDPGRVTVRRLNRVEYRNTVRDLLGVDFDTEKAFPPDDSGHGFDTIGDVLTLPPILLEKYLAAAREIVTKAVPFTSRVPAETVIPGRELLPGPEVIESTNANRTVGSALALSYYEKASATARHTVAKPGRFQVLLDFTANERYVDNQFDYNKCQLAFRIDGREVYRRDHAREGGKAFHEEFEVDWETGAHDFALEVLPLTPDQTQVRSLSLRISSITVRGPMDPAHWIQPAHYSRIFPKEPPDSPPARNEFARTLLEPFASRAFRRPVGSDTVDRLVALAESTYSRDGKTFEEGIGQAMVAVLASPRFLFREEGTETPATALATGIGNGGGEVAKETGTRIHPFIDEFALASRLSYFLWSSMPDAELFRLAGERMLRANLDAQVRRMLADSKAEELVRHFVGQWLQARDIETIQIDARQVLAREATPDPDQDRRRQRFRELRDRPETSLTPEEKKELEAIRGTFFRRFGRAPRAELTGDLRRAMRRETEMVFAHVLREDRSLLELLDSDYTFLNERLARHYGLTNLNVTGDAMVRVQLPPDSPRGGVLTQGTVLAVTSNPTRTSPVKRGLFILDNLLGTPPPPPPPDIPPLEDAAKAMKEKTLSLRETLALHREQPLCSSCHNRMDPLGLALENFNAMGMWRDQEGGKPIDATGTLMSGESFSQIRELKRILVENHAGQFYHTLTEKLLTYALGRGLDFHDVPTVDHIVQRLEAAGGRPSVLISALIESAPFQKTRALPADARTTAQLIPGIAN
ncbi:MAG: DUF1592 domain-containing protein [Limisphaerales bacterium]